MRDFRLATWIALFVLGAVSLQAGDDAVPEANVTSDSVVLNKSACRKGTDGRSFCLETKLRFPDLATLADPSVKKPLEKAIHKYLTAYEESRPYTDLQEFADDREITGEWYTHTRLDIFSLTPATLTLMVEEIGYSGGAHGYDEIRFENYDLETGRRLALEDLLTEGGMERLLKTAETVYRKEHRLKPGDSMRKDEWFEKEFKLAQNFALTKKGLLFYYNSYEIKPYACGPTRLLIPYGLLKGILSERFSLTP
jgi:hypothetical protein